jgi:ribosomal protein L22
MHTAINASGQSQKAVIWKTENEMQVQKLIWTLGKWNVKAGDG